MGRIATLEIRFGPARSAALDQAVTLARSHADDIQELAGGAYRAIYRPAEDERAYGWAAQLAWMAHGWKTTSFEVNGSPELAGTVLTMLWCARRWLRSHHACREEFGSPEALPDKCRGCALFDAGWAAESRRPPEQPPAAFLQELGTSLADAPWMVIEVPDYPPQEWD